MTYRAIGIMSGSSLDGMDICFVEFVEQGGSWTFDNVIATTYPYSPAWKEQLMNATNLNAQDYLLLHSSYGKFIGEEVNRFINEQGLQYRVALVSSHGHTTFHLPKEGMTAQLGEGSAIAAQTSLPVVSDLRALDVALGGQGAPIVPIGERLLFPSYKLFLNLGGIANISLNTEAGYKAFDVCPANRVLNLLAEEIGKEFDRDGEEAAKGKEDELLLGELNNLTYYFMPPPKSLANDFGTHTIYPHIISKKLSIPDALHTYCRHIAMQIETAIPKEMDGQRMMVTGGGALNSFLVDQIRTLLAPRNIEVDIPSKEIVNYKEAIIMGLIGVLRWREEENVLSSVTGSMRNSVGGALWMGQS